MKIRRAALFLAFAAALIGAGLLSAKWFPRPGTIGEEDGRIALDSAARAAWQRANPWLFRNDSLEAFHGRLLLPFAVENSLEPRGVRRRGAFTEIVFPRGRPIHAIAHELETRAARAGFRVAEGREIGSAADQVEYRLEDAGGRPFPLRVLLGRAESPGAFRMALVVTDLGRASEADRRAWIDFPVAVTLVFPDTVAAPVRGKASGTGGPDRDVLVELPMEPAAYPHVRPGPRALFIHHTREETERILRGRLEAHPRAAGFATRHGDRAIENPALMENVLSFTAARGLLFLDLTGSPRSLAPQTALRTGAEIFIAAAQEAGSGKILEAELDRRAAAARRSGEGVWVLRHAPGLPAALARAIRPAPGAPAEPGPRWVTLRELRSR